MKARKIDLLAIGLSVIILVVLILVTGKEMAKWVPADEKHRPFYEAVKKGNSKTEVERGCPCKKVMKWNVESPRDPSDLRRKM